MANRNDGSFVSSIPQPSKNGTPCKGLREMSASATNAMAQTMGPPAKGIPRKTLSERAGEPINNKHTSNSAQSNGMSLAGISRNTSYSSHGSFRAHSSASSRTASNSSYTSSLSASTRQPSSSSYRSNSAFGGSRLNHSVQGRPVSSLEPHHNGPQNGPPGQVLGKRKAFDIDQRFEEIENMQKTFANGVEEKLKEHEGFQEKISRDKVTIADLKDERDRLSSQNRQLQLKNDELNQRVTALEEALHAQKRNHNDHLEDLERRYRREIEDLRHEEEKESRRLLRQHEQSLDDIEGDFNKRLAEEQDRHQREIQTLNKEGSQTQEQAQKELDQQRSAFSTIQEELQRCRSDVSRERDLNENLRDQLAAVTRREHELETSVQRLEGHIQFLESDNKSQSQAFADLEARMQRAIRESEEAKGKLIVEETLRRKLHNQVQELKGNIRVFCRVRPSLQVDVAEAAATINYPDDALDAKELEVVGVEEKSSLGNITTRKHAFNFDRVFGPSSQNGDIFAEISQLVQSALDGYNVCIFCYGQTGSGKTFTMSAADGMIPLAVNQIYTTAKNLEEKGWKYSMSGSFIEVYNENLNDLLGRAEEFDKKKHEIRHDTQKCKTEVTGIRTVDLDSPGKVEEILRNANRNRTVAATQANERSSRSHSVFILKLVGENSVTGERSEGTLNLVDLAGSERLSHSGATGDRLKETQNINKSLSCLGDVIGALGQGKEGGHIPYRNSKLTYLLQFSLGGNSKTLMFVMISPQQAHLSETLTSLKFATKVHNTHIGTARKQTKMKD